MDFKMTAFIALTMLAPVSAISVPTYSHGKYVAPRIKHAAPDVQYAALIAPSMKIVVAEGPVEYKFNYSIHDEHNRNVNSHQEARKGDVVHGQYSLIEPNGHRRIVDYTADKHSGFNAVIRREQVQDNVSKSTAPTPVEYVAPAQVKSAAPTQYTAPIAPSMKIVVAEGPIEYKFNYSIHDEHSRNVNSHQQSRKGDVVHGQYSLIEPNGHRRIVDYTADKHNGFNAVIRRERVQGNVSKSTAPTPVEYIAPSQVKFAAPTQYEAPIASSIKTIVAEGPVEYKFAYSVKDEHNQIVNSHQESRKGDVVHGQYSLIEPNSHRRIVDYTADKHNGFNAVIRRQPIQGNVSKSAAPAQVKYETPLQVNNVAPAQVQYTAPVVQCASHALQYAAPMTSSIKTIVAEGPIEYAFAYSVQDEHSRSVNSHQQSRKGDVVRGQYSLIEPDGQRRVVDYTADKHSGFNAVIRRQRIQGNVSESAAPAEVKYVAPVQVQYTAPAIKYVAPAIQYAAPIAPSIKSVNDEGPVEYEFAYSVQDEHSRNVNSHQQSRKGDVVHGQYSLIEPNGHRRIVDYTVDKHKGFNAVIRRQRVQGNISKYAAPAQVKYVAPAHVKYVAPAQVKYAAPAVQCALPEVQYATANASSIKTIVAEGPVKYEFAYSVQDKHSRNINSHQESRKGDVVHGQYSLIEPNGHRRIVDYTVDKHSGFNAVIRRQRIQGNVSKSAAPAQVKYAAPAQVKYVVPSVQNATLLSPASSASSKVPLLAL